MLLLEIKRMSHDFGGLRAVNNYGLTIEPGQIRGLIGPNGAGKTTIFNLITGIYRPTEGDILLEGKSIVGLKPYQIASMGLGRTFQNLRFLPVTVAGAEERSDQSVANLGVAGHLHMLKHSHMPPQPQILEGPAKAHCGDLVGLKAHNILAIQDDSTFSRFIDAADQVKDGGLASPVGPDQPSDLAGFDLQVVVVDGPQTAKIVAHFFNSKQWHATSLLLSSASVL